MSSCSICYLNDEPQGASRNGRGLFVRSHGSLKRHLKAFSEYVQSWKKDGEWFPLNITPRTSDSPLPRCSHPSSPARLDDAVILYAIFGSVARGSTIARLQKRLGSRVAACCRGPGMQCLTPLRPAEVPTGGSSSVFCISTVSTSPYLRGIFPGADVVQNVYKLQIRIDGAPSVTTFTFITATLTRHALHEQPRPTP